MPAHRLWIGGGGSIQPWEMELATGALRSTASAIDVDGAGGFLEPSVDGLAIYATANVGAAAFSVDPTTGALTHINTMESELGGNPHISLLAGEGEIEPWEAVVLSSYGGGGTSILRVNPEDRSLASGSSASHGETGSGVDPGRQEAPHPHSAFVAPSTGSARRVVVSDLGTDELIAYDVDGGRLTRVSTFASNPGAGPRHLCFHANSQWIYSINELDCTMTVLSYSMETGALGPALQTLSTLPDGYDFRNHSSGTALNAEGGPASGPNSSGDFGNKAHVGTIRKAAEDEWNQTNTCAHVEITPDGRFLYGSNRGHDSLVCYSVGADGLLSSPRWFATKGHHPRNFSLHPSGSWVVVLNADSDNCVVFALDRATGELTQAGEIVSTPGPTVIKWAPEGAVGHPGPGAAL